jgi:hypothetical protein
MRVEVESPHSADECCERLRASFGGRLRFQWSTFSGSAGYDRVLGRVDGHRVVLTFARGIPSGRVSLGRFGRQLMRVRIEPSGAGSKIIGAIRYPYLDRILWAVAVVAAVAAAFHDVSTLFLIPLAFAVFWVGECILMPGPAHRDADYLLAGLVSVVYGKVDSPASSEPARR